MDKERYYTPTIEEFHIGFEFEVDYGSRWVKEAIYTAPQVVTLPYMKLENIRVKYLDKEDIESLGFKPTLATTSHEMTIYIKYNGRVSLTFIPHLHKLKINIQDRVRTPNLDKIFKEYTVFQGIINNKSELKALLKQLNIK